MGPFEHFELCVRRTPDFSSIQHSRQDKGGIQPQGGDRMEGTKPSHSTVERKRGLSQIDVSQGPVD